jgi:hypothetical protein
MTQVLNNSTDTVTAPTGCTAQVIMTTATNGCAEQLIKEQMSHDYELDGLKNKVSRANPYFVTADGVGITVHKAMGLSSPVYIHPSFLHAKL